MGSQSWTWPTTKPPPGELSVAACGIVFPDQGSNRGFLLWERGVSATGLSGKSQEQHFLFPVEAPVLVQVLNMFVFN